MKYGVRIQGSSSLKLCVAKSLPIKMRGKVAELSALRTSEDARRQGHASALLSATTAEADAAHMLLMLRVDPEDGVERAGLIELYQRFGFIIVQMQPMLMVRPVGGLQ